MADKLAFDGCINSKDVNLSKQRKKSSSSRVEFSLQVEVKCPEHMVPGTVLKEGAAAAPPVLGDDVIPPDDMDDAEIAPEPDKGGIVP